MRKYRKRRPNEIIYVAEELKEELTGMSLQVEKLEKNMAKLTIEAGGGEMGKGV